MYTKAMNMWKQIKTLTYKTRGDIEMALEVLTNQADWVNPIIKKLPRNVSGSEHVAWDVQEDGSEYPILVWKRDTENGTDYIAIPNVYSDEGAAFCSFQGEWVTLTDNGRDYVLAAEAA